MSVPSVGATGSMVISPSSSSRLAAAEAGERMDATDAMNAAAMQDSINFGASNFGESIAMRFDPKTTQKGSLVVCSCRG